jgi:hypothetical protein
VSLLVATVRWRVGVNSTTTVSEGVTAAVRPTPTKNRRIANKSHETSGMKAINPELVAQMKVPITICCLRPQASAKAQPFAFCSSQRVRHSRQSLSAKGFRTGRRGLRNPAPGRHLDRAGTRNPRHPPLRRLARFA